MDRERMIEVLKKDRGLAMFNPMTGECVPMNEDNAESAEALTMAIAALEQAPRWIPMSEKKPGEMQECLVCDKNGIILIDTYIGKPAPYIWNWNMSDYAAWMPLPAPYKKGEQHGKTD